MLVIPVQHTRGRVEHPRPGVYRGIPGMKQHINVDDKVAGKWLTMEDPYYVCSDSVVPSTRTGKEKKK